MILFYRRKCDYIKFSGKDRLDLLNRLSTNDIKELPPYKGKKTILTTDKGRIVDILTLYPFQDFIFSSCSFNNSESVTKHLDKYTIMEDFKAINMAVSHRSIMFFGGGCEEFCKELFEIDLRNLSDNDFSIFRIEGKDTIIARNDDAFGGFVLVYSAEDSEVIEAYLSSSDVDQKFKAEEINEETFEELRIVNGVPRLGNEMGELSNPLECNLTSYISFTKGCYIGQEVIARLDTYDKVSKHMTGITADENLSGLSPLSDLRIMLDNKECGIVTSAAESVKYGHVGLGFVKTAFLDYEKEYKIKSKDKNTNCKIVKLPFN